MTTTTPRPDLWAAYFVDRSGWVENLADYEGVDIGDIDPEDARVVIVRGTAAPTGPAGDMRLPGTYRPEDRIVEWDDFETSDEVQLRLAQAEAMAVGLNAELLAEVANRG